MHVFDRRAMKMIHETSQGIPRLINLIAERSLIAGYLTAKQKIGKKEVKAAVKDLDL